MSSFIINLFMGAVLLFSVFYFVYYKRKSKHRIVNVQNQNKAIAPVSYNYSPEPDNSEELRYYLQVPFKEKELAKTRGAKWNPIRKQWYTFDISEYEQFRKWLNFDSEFTVFADSFFIAESSRLCWKCVRETPVYALYLTKYEYAEWPDYIDMTDEMNQTPEWFKDSSAFFTEPSEIHVDSIKSFQHIQHPIIQRIIQISSTQNGQQYCKNCSAKQGNFFLFEEVDSPFGFLDNDRSKKIKLYKIQYPIKINAGPNYDSSVEYFCLHKNNLFETI